MAYNALAGLESSASALNSKLLIMDIAVASVCGAACALSLSEIGAAVSPAAAIACGVGAVGEGIVEIASTVKEMQSSVQQYADTATKVTEVASLVGGAAGVGGATGILGYLDYQCQKKPESPSCKAAAEERKKEAAEKAFDENGKDAVDEKGTKTATDPGRKGKEACASAAVFAFLAGLRAYNLMQVDEAAKKECETVNSLYAQVGH